MVSSGAEKYLAVIDWGSAAWGNPANDFAGIPLGQSFTEMTQDDRQTGKAVEKTAHDESQRLRSRLDSKCSRRAHQCWIALVNPSLKRLARMQVHRNV